MRKYILISLVCFSLNSCVTKPSSNQTNKPQDSNQKQPDDIDDITHGKRVLYLTVLDCNNDTLGNDELFFIDSTLNNIDYPNKSHHTVSFDDFKKIYPAITDEYTFSYRNALFMKQAGDLAAIKRKHSTNQNKKFKYNFVGNINWTKVNATDIRADIAGWRVSSGEYLTYVQMAASKNYSYAQCEAHSLFNDSTSSQYINFIESAKDSLFIEDSDKNSYYFTFGNLDRYAFRFQETGLIADINQDGYADRIATWNTYYCAGICGITKKSKKGLITFFEYSE